MVQHDHFAAHKNGEGWRETNTLRRDDLPVAMKAIDMAYSWMWRKQVQLQKAERNAADKVLASEGR